MIHRAHISIRLDHSVTLRYFLKIRAQLNCTLSVTDFARLAQFKINIFITKTSSVKYPFFIQFCAVPFSIPYCAGNHFRIRKESWNRTFKTMFIIYTVSSMLFGAFHNGAFHEIVIKWDISVCFENHSRIWSLVQWEISFWLLVLLKVLQLNG